MIPASSVGSSPVDPQLALQPAAGEDPPSSIAGRREITVHDKYLGFELVIPAVVELSGRLFPGPVSYEWAVDPEDPSHRYVVFDVTAKGPYADYRDRILEWHDKVEEVLPKHAGEFRLIVHPQ